MVLKPDYIQRAEKKSQLYVLGDHEVTANIYCKSLNLPFFIPFVLFEHRYILNKQVEEYFLEYFLDFKIFKILKNWNF